jgi:hypothetical protein
MYCNRFSAISRGRHEQAERAQRALLEKRRRYNRLYMRHWRADPRHQAYERANRERWHYERKLRSAQRSDYRSADKCGVPVCGFCRKSPPVMRVMRLEIREYAPRGYVEVRIPYCGEC